MAKVHKRAMPYLYENFNVNMYFATLNKYNNSVLSCILNAVIEGLNEEDKKIPEYIIFVIDKDLLEDLHFCDFGLHKLLEGTLQLFYNQICTLFEACREDLCMKCNGVISSTSAPVMIWLPMLERPGFSQTFRKNFLSLHWKFNNILNEVILQNSSGYGMSIEIDKVDFTICGDLTSSGRYNFWKQFLDQFQQIDKIQASSKTNTVENDQNHRENSVHYNYQDHEPRTHQWQERRRSSSPNLCNLEHKQHDTNEFDRPCHRTHHHHRSHRSHQD